MNVLSLPTWIIHVSSVIEWITAIWLVWLYAEVSGNLAWRSLSLGMLPALVSAMCACTWHFFDNPPALGWLVTLQAATTVVGNMTMCLAGWHLSRGVEGTGGLGDWGTRGLGDWGTGGLGDWGTGGLCFDYAQQPGDWGTANCSLSTACPEAPRKRKAQAAPTHSVSFALAVACRRHSVSKRREGSTLNFPLNLIHQLFESFFTNL